jgi:diacylglycerol kinase (ATP)
VAAWLGSRIGLYSTVVIAGGDGTLGLAYTLASEQSDLTLGYIPAGFGNATSHLLDLPREPEALASILARGEARPIDLVAVDGRLALFAGAGWDALVSGRYAATGSRRLSGWAGAIAGSLPELWHRFSVEVMADDRVVHRGPMELLVVSTTPYYGRGLRVNPGARTDAGRLSLRVYPGPAPQLAAEVGRWAIRVAPRARRVDARRVEVRALDERDLPLQADGDVIGARHGWSFDVHPAAVRLIGRWS